ncbi:MAG: ABC transporter ATP-binding protein [Sphingomonadales bacterium]|nr:ABC transporter ATP-binding protein [Sphingomonadales bacterium]MBU3993960.1 ABC transporter ATP-binding protein [Alphaproteobacteria bacterium]
MLSAQNLTLPSRLHDVSLTLGPGEVTAILGPNGAGKSTLLACLAGLLVPTQGTVALSGTPLVQFPPRTRARRIGYLPQSPEVAWDVHVETLVRLGRLPWQGAPLHRPHTSPAEDDAATAEALAAMDLEAFRHRPLSRLSGGERARALAARVLAGRPQWLLADEPLANLDLAHAAALVARLKAQAHEGRGVVLVLHDLATAMNHAARVIVLANGAVAADGPPETALTAELIENIWGVPARWLGEPGARALALG